MNIKYLGYFDIDNKNRSVVLSCVNKMKYIYGCFIRLGYNVEIISYANAKVGTTCKGQTQTLQDGALLTTFDSKTSKNKIVRFLQKKLFNKKVLRYLVKNIKDDDVLVVYHSLGYTKLIEQFKKRKRTPIIIDVEEIYADVCNYSVIQREKELKYFELASAYLFATDMLNKVVNKQNKPNVAINGSYQVNERIADKFKDGKIHVVYSGTLDPRKGVVISIQSAEYLDGNYHLHILGFGSNLDKQKTLTAIKEICEKTQCQITFDGLLQGEDYIRFLQKCDVGLSPQNPEAKFNDTSFPSKVLTYMSNGLKVVSINIPVIKNAKVGKCIYFYNNQNPKEIALTIQNAVNDNSKEDVTKELSRIDSECLQELKQLLSNINQS